MNERRTQIGCGTSFFRRSERIICGQHGSKVVPLSKWLRKSPQLYIWQLMMSPRICLRLLNELNSECWMLKWTRKFMQAGAVWHAKIIFWNIATSERASKSLNRKAQKRMRVVRLRVANSSQQQPCKNVSREDGGETTTRNSKLDCEQASDYQIGDISAMSMKFN